MVFMEWDLECCRFDLHRKFVVAKITCFALFFFKQKTAYEMRISDWSSDVCSSDLNLSERTVEREMIPMAREMGMGVCPWSPLGGGVLAGKYSRKVIGRAACRERVCQYE